MSLPYHYCQINTPFVNLLLIVLTSQVPVSISAGPVPPPLAVPISVTHMGPAPSGLPKFAQCFDPTSNKSLPTESWALQAVDIFNTPKFFFDISEKSKVGGLCGRG